MGKEVNTVIEEYENFLINIYEFHEKMSILTSKYTSPNVYSYYSRNDNHFYLEIFMFNSIEITFESNIDDYDPYEIGFPGSIENVKIQIIK